MRSLVPSFYTIKDYLGGQLTGQKNNCVTSLTLALMYFRRKSYEAQLSVLLMLLTHAKHDHNDFRRTLSMHLSACLARP
jgi:hypothetical protein